MKGILLLPVAFSLTACGYIPSSDYVNTVYTPSSCCNAVVVKPAPVVRTSCCKQVVRPVVVRRPVVTNTCCTPVQTTNYEEVTVINEQPVEVTPTVYEMY
ncbi:hypothetical protein Lbir_0291 [Legionella birminghamensis]|uniref:Uncharacterized protein n=1 Tax=Legionella birminghamensis TaxID=28083 RepID=A0A378II89_9GAMM|nr:hypothetical protein [Legionella birminghamensis]KTC75571.1 hypothetical protein Lbir_0291 [Legionella birminghamensis]STX31894.1 Uncharacterised protein [Legionella birminghamensis]